MPASPSTANYYVGKGIVKTKAVADPDVDVSYVDMGNCPKFSVTPQTEMKEHFAVVSGVGVMDFASITTRSLQVTIHADEITNENLHLALGMSGGISAEYSERSVRFWGTNEYGQQAMVYLPHVLFMVN